MKGIYQYGSVIGNIFVVMLVCFIFTYWVLLPVVSCSALWFYNQHRQVCSDSPEIEKAISTDDFW